MKPINIKEFKQLIERYESITLKEIEEKNADIIKLTGFGSYYSCSLCKNINPIIAKCEKCVYNLIEPTIFSCSDGENSETYKAIQKASTTKELLQAYRNRAKHMRQILTDLKFD